MTVSPTSATREAGTSQPTRRSVKRRLSPSHLFIAIVVILAFVLNFLALQSRDATTLVAVADAPLGAGSAFSVDGVRMIEVPADFEALDTLVVEDRLSAFEGWVLKRSIPAGGLIESGAFADPGLERGLRSMSIPIDVAHAAGGTIGPGDWVDVISVEDGAAAFVAADVEVLSVAEIEGASLGVIGDYHIVVAIDAEQALRLAEAIDGGSLEVIRSTGAPEVEIGVGADES